MMLLTFEKHCFEFSSWISFSICLSLVHLLIYPVFLGNRYITTSESLWAPEMAKILEEEFKPLGKTILVGVEI